MGGDICNYVRCTVCVCAQCVCPSSMCGCRVCMSVKHVKRLCMSSLSACRVCRSVKYICLSSMYVCRRSIYVENVCLSSESGSGDVCPPCKLVNWLRLPVEYVSLTMPACRVCQSDEDVSLSSMPIYWVYLSAGLCFFCRGCLSVVYLSVGYACLFGFICLSNMSLRHV